MIAISENGGKIAVIMGNPVMIDPYRKGVRGNRESFPDGAKMAKIHSIPKKQETYSGPLCEGEPGQHTERSRRTLALDDECWKRAIPSKHWIQK